MKYFFFSLILIIIGCSFRKTYITDLDINNHRFYFDGREVLYTGLVYSKFKDGQGISGVISIKDGIPNGLWKSYDYKGELVQHGFFQPYLLKYKELIGVKKINRVNVLTISEGEEDFINVIFITDQIKLEVNRSDKKSLEKVFVFLKSNSIHIDTSRLNKIIFKKMEF